MISERQIANETIDPLAAVSPSATRARKNVVKSLHELVEIQIKKKSKLKQPNTVALDRGCPNNVVTLYTLHSCTIDTLAL